MPIDPNLPDWFDMQQETVLFPWLDTDELADHEGDFDFPNDIQLDND